MQLLDFAPPARTGQHCRILALVFGLPAPGHEPIETNIKSGMADGVTNLEGCVQIIERDGLAYSQAIEGDMEPSRPNRPPRAIAARHSQGEIFHVLCHGRRRQESEVPTMRRKSWPGPRQFRSATTKQIKLHIHFDHIVLYLFFHRTTAQTGQRLNAASGSGASRPAVMRE